MRRPGKYPFAKTVFSMALAIVAAAVAAAAEQDDIRSLPVQLSAEPMTASTSNVGQASSGPAPLDLALGPGFPAECHFSLSTSTWFNVKKLEWAVILPANAPTNVQVLAFLKDWDYLWYQQLLPGYLRPGAANACRVNLSPDAPGWIPREHEAAWNARVLVAPKDVGIRLFADAPGATTCRIENAQAFLAPPDSSPPLIGHVIPNTANVPCYSRFEVTFDLPDRYPNPFDPDEVSVEATFAAPDGTIKRVDGFFSQSYHRQVRPTGERTVPQGPAHWKVRYAPTVPGAYRYFLAVRDRTGSASWGPATFRATPASNPGYLRVSRKDPRYFEFEDGTPFNPIGHNIRSPSDDRMNAQFAWSHRWTEGTAAYARYFHQMERHGENIAEVWQSPWALGLEWSDKWPGYHNAGQYNLRNAWEMDQVVEGAERRGIRLNVVIHNHGKFGCQVDSEWQANPLNKALGGFLESPNDYFTDPRALKSFRNLVRYDIARWGYSTSVFAWELWSELNLTGTSGANYRRQEVVDWHRVASTAIKDMDFGRHLVSTHTSGDYTTQNTNIIALAELDYAAVDAYYMGNNQLQIVSLLGETARFNNTFGKPVLPTEFGGAWNAQGVSHLENCLHAGLWASTSIPVAGTPLFWWWGLIEEENLYPEYLALSRFMKGEDRRDPALVSYSPALSSTSPPTQVQAQCLRSPGRAIGWIYVPDEFTDTPVAESPPVTGVSLSFGDATNGTFKTEFWETVRGTVVRREETAAANGLLTVPVPPFKRDIAFKVRRNN